MTLLALSEMEWIGIYLIIAVVSIAIFYFIIRAAVKGGILDAKKEEAS